MMWKTQRYAHASALPAIAAALALSSTPAWSQEVQPSAEPAPVTVDAPPPVVDTAPATTDTAPTADPAPVIETPTAAPAAAAKPKAKASVTKSTKTVPSKPATTTRVASTAAPAAPAAAPVAAAPAAPPTTTQPIVDTSRAETAQAAPAPEVKPMAVDENALMFGGGALALLALGGGAYAMTRRRRRDEDVFVEETAMNEPVAAEPEPIVETAPFYEAQPAIVAPSAFAWGNAQPAETQVEHIDGETWVERAHRGPTPDNPSLSLRKRLKRAAFFDAREKRVAEGKAEPVDSDAGLPENVANDTPERQLELA